MSEENTITKLWIIEANIYGKECNNVEEAIKVTSLINQLIAVSNSKQTKYLKLEIY